MDELLVKIRQLPPGTQSRVIQAAHRIADDKNSKANSWGAQYASLAILYYDEDTWTRALALVEGA